MPVCTWVGLSVPPPVTHRLAVPSMCERDMPAEATGGKSRGEVGPASTSSLGFVLHSLHRTSSPRPAVRERFPPAAVAGRPVIDFAPPRRSLMASLCAANTCRLRADCRSECCSRSGDEARSRRAMACRGGKPFKPHFLCVVRRRSKVLPVRTGRDKQDSRSGA